MSTFKTTKLTNDRVLVTGTNDAGEACSTILDGSQLKKLAQEKDVLLAGRDFDNSVESFFAPLTEAAEKLSAAIAPAPVDPAFLYVIDEGCEGAEEVEPLIHELDHASAVLRMIFTGNTARLVWVKTSQQDSIEVLEYEPKHAEDLDEDALKEYIGSMLGGAGTVTEVHVPEDDEPASDPGIDIQVAEGLSETEPFEGLAEEDFDSSAE